RKMFRAEPRIAQNAVVLADEQTVVGDAEDFVVKFPCPLIKPLELAGKGAHVVQMKTIDRNNELGKVELLVNRVHVTGEDMKKRARRDVRNKIRLGLGFGRTNSPPIVDGKFAESFEFHFVGQSFGAFGAHMGSFENFFVVFDEAEVWTGVWG